MTNNSGVPKASRIRYVDFMKAIAMIMVIIGHINFANDAVKVWVYSFHMPVFFFATGLVLKEKQVGTLKEYIGLAGKYLRRLILPYILWGLIFSDFSVLNCVKILYGSYPMISGAGTLTSLWFLPVMFVAVMLYYTVQILLGKKFLTVTKCILTVAALGIGFLAPKVKWGYPWGLNVAFTAFAFLLLGNLMKQPLMVLYNRMVSMKKTGYAICLAGAAASMVICYFLSGLNVPRVGGVLMGKGEYGNPWLFLLTSVLGICGIYFFSVWMEGIPFLLLKAYLIYVGQNTLCIFCLQKVIIGCFKTVFTKVTVPDIAALLVTTVLTLVLSTVVGELINEYVPVLAGKQER